MRVHETPTQINTGSLKQLQLLRADQKTAVRLTLQFGLFVLSFVALLWLSESGSTALTAPYFTVARCAALGLFSFMLFALYAPFHESTHKTAFSSSRANTAVVWVTGILYGYSPGLHREFHFEHHRLTNEEEDPEAGFGLPAMPLRLPCQALLAGLLGSLVPLHSVVLAVTPTRYWDQAMAAWAPPVKRAKLAWECRVVALVWVVGVSALIYTTDLAIELMIALVLARSIHGLVTVTEHEELPGVGSQANRTRTVMSNAVFRWFWWNMNFHAEHHSWPAIPWHQLPKANLIMDSGLPHREQSYFAFLAGETLLRRR